MPFPCPWCMMSTMSKERKKPWPQRLKDLRTRLGLTQDEAAKRCRISQSQWATFEAGKRKPTRPVAFLIELLEQEEI